MQTFTENIREAVEIQEARVERKAKMVEVTIIKAGYGNKVHNHYYSPTLLEAEAQKFVGAPMHADHPDPAVARRNGGVRSIRDLVGRIKEARYDAATQSIKGKAQVLQNWLWEIVENDPRSLAVSIVAQGSARPGVAEGRNGNLVETFGNVKAVDYVTVGGAGGQVEAILESQLEADMEDITLEQVTGNPELLSKVQAHLAATGKDTSTDPAAAATTAVEGGITKDDISEIVEAAVTKATDKMSAQHARDIQLRDNRAAVEKRLMRESAMPERSRSVIAAQFHDAFYEGDITEGDKTLTPSEQLMRDVEAAIEDKAAELKEAGFVPRSTGRVTGMGPSGGAASFAEGGNDGSGKALDEESFTEAAPTAANIMQEFDLDKPWDSGSDEDDDDND